MNRSRTHAPDNASLGRLNHLQAGGQFLGNDAAGISHNLFSSDWWIGPEDRHGLNYAATSASGWPALGEILEFGEPCLYYRVFLEQLFEIIRQIRIVINIVFKQTAN
jgi:hypothetical protein